MGKNTAGRFVEIIDEQAALYKTLKETVKKESEAIAQKDAAAIDGIVKAEEDAMEKIKALEGEKSALFAKMAEEAGLAPGSARIGDILKRMGGDDASAIGKAVSGLLAEVREVDLINAGNARLLKNFIEFAGFSEILRQKIKEPEQTVYTKSGDKKTEKDRNAPKIDRTI